MQKGVLVFSLLLVFLSFGIFAQEDAGITPDGSSDVQAEIITEAQPETIPDEPSDEVSDAQLTTEAGITPDSALYFLDKFFDRFGDDLQIKEERIAEIKAMIEAGDFEAAETALEGYKESAEALEVEIDPDRAEDAKESAEAITNAVEDLEEQLDEEQKVEFVDDVIKQEESIVTAAEIASKIRDLCETLAEIDPLEYSRVCRTNNEDPEWHKRLDKDLTEEQRQEAEKFGEIMSECFETSGQQCRCEEIPFTEFAEMCSVAAPLATACEINDNEEACEELDNLEMPELPDHLQDVFDSLEGDISEAQFDLHMPRECREAGVDSPRECMKIMIQTNAPEECRNAILEADIQNEREAREICEKIMFEQNAPEECIEAGLTNPKECGKLMFQQNAPEECIEAGLTGETRGDEKKCREIMEQQGEGREGFRGPEGGFGGGNCQGIQNSEERLKCYDSAVGGAHEYRDNYQERFRETQEAQRQCAERCASQNQAWSFSNGNCECFEGNREDYSQYYQDRSNEEQFSEQQQPPQEFTEPAPSGEFSESAQQPTPETTTESSTTTNEIIGSTGGTTGAVIFSDTFSKYYFR